MYIHLHTFFLEEKHFMNIHMCKVFCYLYQHTYILARYFATYINIHAYARNFATYINSILDGIFLLYVHILFTYMHRLESQFHAIHIFAFIWKAISCYTFMGKAKPFLLLIHILKSHFMPYAPILRSIFMPFSARIHIGKALGYLPNTCYTFIGKAITFTTHSYFAKPFRAIRSYFEKHFRAIFSTHAYWQSTWLPTQYTYALFASCYLLYDQHFHII